MLKAKKFLKRIIAIHTELRPSKSIVIRNALIPFALLLCFCQISHADDYFRKDSPDLGNFYIDSKIQAGQFSEKLELSLIGDQDGESLLSFGGSLGFGASYIVLGIKGYVGTPHVRVFALVGLGVAAGVDVKLGNIFELGLTRALVLGGASWDVAALRYHPNGAFNNGWFFGIEYIGNRESFRGLDTEDDGPRWFGTFGYDF